MGGALDVAGHEAEQVATIDQAVEELLGPAFTLEFDEDVWILEGADGDELFEFWARSAPPFRAMIAGLEGERLESFREAYAEFCESYRDGDRVRVPRPYILVLGTKT